MALSSSIETDASTDTTTPIVPSTTTVITSGSKPPKVIKPEWLIKKEAEQKALLDKQFKEA